MRKIVANTISDNETNSLSDLSCLSCVPAIFSELERDVCSGETPTVADTVPGTQTKHSNPAPSTP
jgi:hypothetical protein